MGYTTEFRGYLTFDKEPDNALIEYVNKLSETRRMRRNNDKIKEAFPDWKENCLDGELGVDGEFFVGGKGFGGQDNDPSIIDYNDPSPAQPGLWCNWDIEMHGDKHILCWDGSEKFYYYVEWLKYLIDKIFAPKGYVLNGTIEWRGEDWDDMGAIIVEDNVVSVG